MPVSRSEITDELEVKDLKAGTGPDVREDEYHSNLPKSVKFEQTFKPHHA
ncbi:MAG: hypothetical protein ACON4R_08345 [Akkermansiaceae bacterium]